MPWCASTSIDGHPLVPGRAQRLRRHGGVVQVAGAAVRRPGHVVAGRPAQRVGRALAGGDQVDGGERAVDRGAAPPPTCRARPASSCRRQYRPARAWTAAAGARGARRASPRWRTCTARRGPGRRARECRPHPLVVDGLEVPRSAGSWTARSAASSCCDRLDGLKPVAAEAPRGSGRRAREPRHRASGRRPTPRPSARAAGSSATSTPSSCRHCAIAAARPGYGFRMRFRTTILQNGKTAMGFEVPADGRRGAWRRQAPAGHGDDQRLHLPQHRRGDRRGST